MLNGSNGFIENVKNYQPKNTKIKRKSIIVIKKNKYN